MVPSSPPIYPAHHSDDPFQTIQQGESIGDSPIRHRYEFVTDRSSEGGRPLLASTLSPFSSTLATSWEFPTGSQQMGPRPLQISNDRTHTNKSQDWDQNCLLYSHRNGHVLKPKHGQSVSRGDGASTQHKGYDLLDSDRKRLSTGSWAGPLLPEAQKGSRTNNTPESSSRREYSMFHSPCTASGKADNSQDSNHVADVHGDLVSTTAGPTAVGSVPRDNISGFCRSTRKKNPSRVAAKKSQQDAHANALLGINSCMSQCNLNNGEAAKATEITSMTPQSIHSASASRVSSDKFSPQTRTTMPYPEFSHQGDPQSSACRSRVPTPRPSKKGKAKGAENGSTTENPSKSMDIQEMIHKEGPVGKQQHFNEHHWKIVGEVREEVGTAKALVTLQNELREWSDGAAPGWTDASEEDMAVAQAIQSMKAIVQTSGQHVTTALPILAFTLQIRRESISSDSTIDEPVADCNSGKTLNSSDPAEIRYTIVKNLFQPERVEVSRGALPCSTLPYKFPGHIALKPKPMTKSERTANEPAKQHKSQSSINIETSGAWTRNRAFRVDELLNSQNDFPFSNHSTLQQSPSQNQYHLSNCHSLPVVSWSTQKLTDNGKQESLPELLKHTDYLINSSEYAHRHSDHTRYLAGNELCDLYSQHMVRQLNRNACTSLTQRTLSSSSPARKPTDTPKAEEHCTGDTTEEELSTDPEEEGFANELPRRQTRNIPTHRGLFDITTISSCSSRANSPPGLFLQASSITGPTREASVSSHVLSPFTQVEDNDDSPASHSQVPADGIRGKAKKSNPEEELIHKHQICSRNAEPLWATYSAANPPSPVGSQKKKQRRGTRPKRGSHGGKTQRPKEQRGVCGKRAAN